MTKILLIHGPNLNRLGQRDPSHYGTLTLPEVEERMRELAKTQGHELECFQSNHEGALIDWIQEKPPEAVGLLINPGALAHTSYALHDCLVDCGLPCVEVHLSDVKNREPWRAISVTEAACLKSFYGQQLKSYEEALTFLVSHL